MPSGTGATVYAYNQWNNYNVMFTTDGTHKSYLRQWSTSPQSNVSAYNIQNLDNGVHTLKAELNAYEKVPVNTFYFDWVYIYTNESYATSGPTEPYSMATSTAASTSPPSFTSTTTGSIPYFVPQPLPVSHQTHYSTSSFGLSGAMIGAVVVGAVGGATITVFTAFIVCCTTRRRQRARQPILLDVESVSTSTLPPLPPGNLTIPPEPLQRLAIPNASHSPIDIINHAPTVPQTASTVRRELFPAINSADILGKVIIHHD